MIVYNGRNLYDFGCRVASGTVGNSPERVVETVEVPGRNGTLTIDGGRFRNNTLTYHCYIKENISQNIQGLRAYLLAQSGYKRLEDTRNPEEYRLARYINGFTIDQWDRVGGAFDLVFDCDPRRFLKTGEDVIDTPTILMNPTEFKAKPLLRAYGTGSIALNDYTITITNADTYTDIDLETMNAYKGSTNKNSFVSIPDGAGFEPGENNISLSGITKLEITPKWWTI